MGFLRVGDTKSAQVLQILHKELPEESRQDERLMWRSCLEKDTFVIMEVKTSSKLIRSLNENIFWTLTLHMNKLYRHLGSNISLTHKQRGFS